MAESRNFNIVQTIAAGGTAVLYKAVQVSLDRVVAIKRLHPHLTQDDNFTRRFVLEAKAAASLDHEHIVRVIDFGVEDGNYQMVMEFVEGESLKEVLDRWRPLHHELALALVHQICRGLEHAHDKGIVHRDIKPGNVMLTRAGTVKITDFGLAKLVQGGGTHTAADSILGTPLYMSPEQAFGESVDQRSDLFSLGTVLYELLTGRQPFVSENYMGVIQNIIHREIPSVRELNPAVPPAVEAIAMRALAKNRDERYQSAREFAAAIEQVLGLDGLARAGASLPALLEHGTPTRVMPRAQTAARPGPKSSTWSTVSTAGKKPRARRAAWLLGGVAVVAMGGVSAWLWWQHGPGRAEQTAAPGVVQHSSPVETPGFGVPFDAPAPAPADSAAAHPADPVTVVAAPDTAGVPAPVQDAPAGVTESPSPKPAAPAAIEAEKPFREGYLLIRAEPSAQVFVNGIYRGEAAPALRLTLPAGTHSIECRDERHETYAETLRIVAGETSQRNILLRQLKGIISLATTEGAEFYVDGRLVGITPITRPIEVEAGTHTLTIKKDRHYTWTSEVVVEANGTLPLRITLSPRF